MCRPAASAREDSPPTAISDPALSPALHTLPINPNIKPIPEMLDKDMIKEPRMWQLVMEASPDTLSVMAFSPIEHHTLISEEIPLANTATSPLKGFQEAVYDNPLLLADFRKTTILLPTPRAMLVPDILTDTSRREQAFREAFPPSGADGPEEILAEELPALGATMLTAINREFLGFLRRTFNNPRISHTLTPLVLYFKAKHPTRPHGKMIANLRQGRCDIVILGDKAPMVMNSYPVRDPMDSVYYIMACREAFGLSATDELILAGDNASRGAVTPVLRRFIRYVMPAIFPSTMFRAGRAALRTPFEMIVAPLALPSS